jgi:hypothetical protein
VGEKRETLVEGHCDKRGKQRKLIRPLRTTVEANVRMLVSERETVVERPWLHADCCPCVVGDVNRGTSNSWYQSRSCL